LDLPKEKSSLTSVIQLFYHSRKTDQGVVSSRIAGESGLKKGQETIKPLDHVKKMSKLVLGERATHLKGGERYC
jgi:hypothetical protein